jgi:hypothetical protein
VQSWQSKSLKPLAKLRFIQEACIVTNGRILRSHLSQHARCRYSKPSTHRFQKEESMEDWVAEKLSQTARKHITNDWADILCFYTATNGVASAAPTRASPAPQQNGKAVSPQEIPQSVSSTDPKSCCSTGQRYAKHCSKKVDWLRWICKSAKSVAPQECPKRIQLQRYGSWYVDSSMG